MLWVSSMKTIMNDDAPRPSLTSKTLEKECESIAHPRGKKSKSKKKYSFLVQKSIYESLEYLSNNDLGLMLRTILQYEIEGVVPDLRSKEYLSIRSDILIHFKESEKVRKTK